MEYLDWESGCVNDQLIKWLKQNGITKWYYDCQQLVFKVHRLWYTLDYTGTVNGKIPLKFILVERLNK